MNKLNFLTADEYKMIERPDSLFVSGSLEFFKAITEPDKKWLILTDRIENNGRFDLTIYHVRVIVNGELLNPMLARSLGLRVSKQGKILLKSTPKDTIRPYDIIKWAWANSGKNSPVIPLPVKFGGKFDGRQYFSEQSTLLADRLEYEKKIARLSLKYCIHSFNSATISHKRSIKRKRLSMFAKAIRDGKQVLSKIPDNPLAKMSVDKARREFLGELRYSQHLESAEIDKALNSIVRELDKIK